jgi:hypothetical protein
MNALTLFQSEIMIFFSFHQFSAIETLYLATVYHYVPLKELNSFNFTFHFKVHLHSLFISLPCPLQNTQYFDEFFKLYS